MCLDPYRENSAANALGLRFRQVDAVVQRHSLGEHLIKRLLAWGFSRSEFDQEGPGRLSSYETCARVA